MNDKKNELEKDIKFKTIELDLAFTKKVIELQNYYNEKLEEMINNNEKLIDAFAKKDRNSLDKLAQKEFDKLIKENPNFEVMCFGLPNMTSFYRTHMPKKYGDDISKVHGVMAVTKLKKRISGFLISKLGLFYRVTFPVYKNGNFIGVIAFGINLGYVNDFIHEKMDTESAVLVDTKQLKQSKWFDMLEEGSIGRYTIISTNGELIDVLKSSNHSIDSGKIRITANEKIYNIVKKDIQGIKNTSIAKIILFQDITKEVSLYNFYLYAFIVVTVLLVLLLIFVLIKTFNKFITTITTINDDLKELNQNLETKVEIEVNKNREKDKHLLEQAKNASLGEMIGNIAHQWRQPLSAITTVASGVKLNNQLGILENNEIDKNMDNIIEKANYLSETIDTFRHFLKDDKKVETFYLEALIENSLKIIKSTLNDLHIGIKNNINYKDKTQLKGIQSELSQVIINIVNNSKDILIEKKVEEPWVKLELTKKEKYVILTIEDNGGGIPDNVMPKIFDPYFTTKHQSQGTGLGLHMSYKIIVESLEGDIYVKNTENGARFHLELPINQLP
jgi:signal transduction histidine kinase